MEKYLLRSLYCIVIFISPCVSEDMNAIIDSLNPLKMAKKGQWVVYRIAGSALQRTSILDIDDNGIISLKTEQMIDGEYKDLTEGAVTMDGWSASKKEMLNDAEDIIFENALCDVLGEELHVVIIYFTKNGLRIKNVLSEKIPIYGDVMIDSVSLPYPRVMLVDYSR